MPPPGPPTNIHSRQPARAPVDGTWYMVARKAYNDNPVYFGTGKGARFSSPSAKYGVTYLARTKEAAFAETIRGSRLHYDASGNLCTYESIVEELELHTFKLKKSAARAIDLTGAGCAKIGARVECFTLGTAQGYKISQQWARKLMTHPVEAVGLLYIGNRAADRCLALFGNQKGTGFGCSVGPVIASSAGNSVVPLLKNRSFNAWLKAVDIRLTAAILRL